MLTHHACRLKRTRGATRVGATRSRFAPYYHDVYGLMGRKPECVSLDCTECGFGPDGGIPTCKALENSEQVVRWDCFEDLEKVGKDGEKKILPNQQVHKEGKLKEFWPIVMEHTKEYMKHHSIAKWQQNCHALCLDTFKDGDVVVETDSIEGYTHEPRKTLTCDRHDRTTTMVAIVHFSPQVWEEGGRVYTTETWIFASADPDHDFDFHRHAMTQIADHYLHGDGRSATATAKEEGRTPRMHMFTDGCAKQYKGKREFRFVARSSRELGFLLSHNFAASSDFKGCHDGFGGILKNVMRKTEKHGTYIIGAAGVVKFLDNFFNHIQDKSLEDYFAKWTPYRVRRVHVCQAHRTA